MEFKRDRYLEILTRQIHNHLIKVITGARRAGKSYLLNTLFYAELIKRGVPEKNIIRFAFDLGEDTDRLEGYFPQEQTRISDGKGGYLVNARKFRAYISELTGPNEQYYLLLDEVQLLEDFVGTLNGFLRHSNFDVYVTGSNSRFLSTDIAAEFKGRGSVIHVLPLSFGEYCAGMNTPVQNAWRDYIVTGGIPLVASMPYEEDRCEYLRNLCEETYLKDIIVRNAVRKTAQIGELFNVLASVIGTSVNPLRLSNTYRSVSKEHIEDETVGAWISFFEDAFVLSKAFRFNIKGRAYIQAPFKVYFEDIGVRNARLHFRQIEETHLMENVIYNELRYRGYRVDVGEVRMNERTDRTDRNGKSIYQSKALEVDFIAVRGNEKYYIQSALNTADEKKMEQELRPLYCIDDSFRKVIITRDGLKPRINERGIYIVDLFDFLLKGEGLERQDCGYGIL